MTDWISLLAWAAYRPSNPDNAAIPVVVAVLRGAGIYGVGYRLATPQMREPHLCGKRGSW